MELTINGRNLEITQRIENYVQKKTGKLDRYMPNLAKIHVDLSEENTRSALQRQVAQITIRDDRGTILRAEERSSDLFAAIDTVVDKLYRQINRYQGKRRRKGRGAGEEPVLMGEPLPVEEEIEEEQAEPAIVRYKRFPVHPMPAEEAVEQMELLGHDFFVFFNPDDEAINVLYKRHDGNYGLLQPELD
ncbi:MAG: ribosome-associated translation inhibitor RaiA [Ardenticatenaceae bacterium]|nr:ribosome-associated translation inhibitor RaiA [Ardenticatenaceae bacterium]MCB9446341.1 ribosome-associated translation inhibitor RaiA [Ardenticatenaceae bacterium]